MTRPRQRFSFDPKYDFSHKPESYWPETPTEETTLAKVKGTARRDLARYALEHGIVTPTGEIDIDFAFTPSLSDAERTNWGRIHPALMGGEFLPDPREEELEIARVELRSTTGDVIQVLARRSHPGAKRPRIRYRVVDEYWDEGSRYEVAPKSSAKPLSFGQLINLIDSTRRVGDHSYSNDRYDIGLVDGIRACNHDEGQDEESLRHFFDVSSGFYPELAAYYDDRADDWFQSIRLEWLDDACETVQRSAARSRQTAVDRPLLGGWALIRAGLIDEAEQLFTQNRDDTDALLGLAAVAQARGDRDLALSLYDQWNDRWTA